MQWNLTLKTHVLKTGIDKSHLYFELCAVYEYWEGAQSKSHENIWRCDMVMQWVVIS